MRPGVPVEQVHYAIHALLDRKGFSDLEVVLESGHPAARAPLDAPVVHTLDA